jgi:integrase
MPGHVRARKDKDGRVRERADGSTIWQARWRPADDPREEAREERNFRTKREAERWISQRDSDVLRGAYAPAKRGEVMLPMLASELRAVWKARGLEPKTVAGYEALLNRWLIGPADPLRPARPCRFRSLKVAAVTTTVVQEFINEVAAARAPNTTRRIFSVLNALLRLAVERRYIAANPCDSASIPKKAGGRGKRMLFLTPQEVRALAEAMPRLSERVAVYVAAYCGPRAGEQWALRRRDFDLLHRTLSIERAVKEINTSAASLDDNKGLVLGPTKTHASRSQRLPRFLADMLETFLAEPSPAGPEGVLVIRDGEDGPAFGYSDDPFDPDAVVFTSANGCAIRHNLFYKRVFKLAVAGRPERRYRRRGIPVLVPAIPAALPDRLHGLRWHDLRHTCASLSLAAPGGNLHVVKERLGHDDIRTTINVYGHLLPSVDEALADGLDAMHAESAPDNVTPLRSDAEAPPEATGEELG